MPEVTRHPIARDGFARILCERKARRAVEIGTDRGAFARVLLDAWSGELLCVDPFEPYGEMPFDRLPDLLMAVQALGPYADRCKIIRASSQDAPAALLPSWRPEFVYIDGDHSLEHVEADIATWWPLLCEGGVLAGHDYCSSHPGVREAVNAFADARRLAVNLTSDSPASWWVVK